MDATRDGARNMKHADHSRDFYKLCVFMEPEYHRLELDLRLLLTVEDDRG